MKTFLRTLACIIVCSTSLSGFDNAENICVQSPLSTLLLPSWNGQLGGLYIPSKGHLHCLIVFAQFPDDSLSVNHPEWPKDQPPRLMNQWIDSVVTGTPTPYSMTDYFNEMSRGQFQFTGKTRFMTAPRTRAQYRALGLTRRDIHTEILQALDADMDFAEFDRWDPEADYLQIERPDKIVDLVMIVWRNIADDIGDPQAKITMLNGLSFLADQADLGYGNDITVDVGAGNLLIKMGWGMVGNIPTGAGITLRKTFTQTPFMSEMQTCVHEVGHLLLGSNEYHVGFGFWGMVSAYGLRNFTANSFERHRLGWITVNDITSVTTATIPDYVTTGVAYRYIIDSTDAQYFYIENHQAQSRWDQNQSGGPMERGIYVLRQDKPTGENGNFSQMRMIPADGLYDWTSSRRETHSCCGSKIIPVLKQGQPNRHTGYHDCDQVHYLEITTGTMSADSTQVLLFEDNNGFTYLDNRLAGDGRDAFRMGYQQVFSPWSNPASQDKFRNSTGFGFEVTAVTATANGDVYTLNFYPQNAASASPAKVQAFAVAPAAQSGGSAVLSWQPNEEPDLKWYKIYRTGVMQSNTVPADTDFTLLATLNATNGGTAVAQWTDTSVNVSTAPYIFGVYYRISAVDSTDKESVKVQQWMYLNQVQGGNGTGKRGTAMEAASVQISVVPNPSADMFWFTFSLPEGGPVVLEVTDVTGRTVATVADRAFVAGEHTIQFDGSFLSKGVYFYRLTTAAGMISGTLSVQ